MKIICLFGQSKENYEGECAPELLAAIDEYGDMDNQQYLNEEQEKYEKDTSIAFVKRMEFEIDDETFNKNFFPQPITLNMKIVNNKI
jgi:hypothetical protein